MKVKGNMTKAILNEEESLKNTKSIRDTDFFTTTELAQKLKMNVQVITRKVKAGEIRAYKIGKDWRIPDQAVSDWLELQTNKPRLATQATAVIQTGHTKRMHLLEYIMAQLEPNRSYTEAELQTLISRQNSNNFEEICCELVATGMVKRDGKELKRNSEYDLLASAY